MRPLTDAQFWGGIITLLLFITAIIAGFLGHYKSINRDILREDRRRLHAWAEQYAQRRAREMFREYVASIRINVPVQLINESDIPWGDTARKDDAA